MTYLICPGCGNECTAIPPCGVSSEHACAADWERYDREGAPWWCEDRHGTCDCGAQLRVDIDDGWATLAIDEGNE